MKSITTAITVIALCVASSLATAETYSEQHEQVKTLFKSDEEKTTKDAAWTSSTTFKVGVIDNGSNRDGYASYACEVLYEHGFKGKDIWVQVIDIVKLTQNGEWEKLGEARCL